MNVDLSQAWRTLQHMVNAFIGALPRLALALIVFVAFFGAARLARALVRRFASRHGGHETLELALGRLAQSAIIVLGFLVAVSAAFPAFSPANVISLLGVGSVAIGFAFKDIFQNFLAGLLILLTKPFRVGDEIAYREFEGTVQDIQTRATLIKTGDGRRVVIPNSDLYTNTVVVNTAFPTRRITHDLVVSEDADVDRACAIVTEVLGAVDGILPDPKADCVVVDLADAGVRLRARWWAKSSAGDAAKTRVLVETRRRLRAEGIRLAYPTRAIFLRPPDDGAPDEPSHDARDGAQEGNGNGTPERPRVAAAANGAGHP